MSEFKNIEPMGRESRRIAQSKEIQEKARLAARREGFQRYVDIGNPTAAAAGSVQHLNEAQRFQTDAAFQERQQRDIAIRKQQQVIESKRAAVVQGEQERWERAEADAEAERQRLAAVAGTGRKNTSSVAYNPLTLSYNDGNDGDRLKYSDDMTQYRATQRLANLASKQHSTQYNPLTGAPLTQVEQRSRPVRPSSVFN
eukprot:TRINITY_DN8364_c0_g1_i1.p1 TRINITY_DN8364_c0_g1~~TRINITY_DN8364_c0_g1_i1.p1  ORF type:complete len:209 (+),score=40.11 TRINITY_DN8364_c0_g1_i1:32-628(+)